MGCRQGISPRISRHHEYDYRELRDVPPASCDAVLLLGGGAHRAQGLLAFLEGRHRGAPAAGQPIISTPNAGYVESIWAADLTYVHAYRAIDLAAVLRCYGLVSEVYRVDWLPPDARMRQRVRHFLRHVLTNLLQVDHARALLLVARRVGPPS